MKRTLFLTLTLAATALCACNEPADPSGTYFDALGDSLLSASKAKYYRAYSDSILLDAGFYAEVSGKKRKFDFSFDPLCFDFRIENPLDPSVDTLRFSLQGKNVKKTTVSILGAIGGSTRITTELSPSIYLDQGVLYTDLSEATFLQKAINTYYRDYFKEDFPVKGKFTSGLPGGLSFDVPDFQKDPFVTKIKECYDVAKSAFSFSEADGVRSLSFASTDPTQLRLILDAMLGRQSNSLASSSGATTGKYTLSDFSFALSYTNIGPSSIRFKVGISFAEGAFQSFEPDGVWKAEGKVTFGYGEPAKRVEDPSSYKEISLAVKVVPDK